MAISIISQPSTLSFAGNQIVFELQSDNPLALSEPTASRFKFLFEVYLENEAQTAFDKIYSERLGADLPFVGKLKIDIHEILESAIPHDIPSPTLAVPSRCTKSKRRYYCRYAEVYGTPPGVGEVLQTSTFHVTSGGLSYIAFTLKTLSQTLVPSAGSPENDRFLRQGPDALTRLDQPQFLYFLNMRSGRTLYLKTSITHDDGSIASQKVLSIFINQYEKVIFPAGYDQQALAGLSAGKSVRKYSCWLEDASANVLSEKVTFNVVPRFRSSTRFLVYANSLGGFSSFLAYGKGSEDYQLNQLQAEKQLPIGYSLQDGTIVSYDISVQRNFTLNTGWMEKRLSDNLIDFYLSDAKFLCTQGRMIPVMATGKKVGESKDGEAMVKQDIAISMAFEDYKFTDQDLEAGLLYAPPIAGLVHYGYCVNRPLTEADILSLPFSQVDSITTFTLNTGLNRKFCVAVPYAKNLLEAYDQTSEEDVTSGYYGSHVAISVNGIPYDVYTMQMAIPYTENHEHIITIQND